MNFSSGQDPPRFLRLISGRSSYRILDRAFQFPSARIKQADIALVTIPLCHPPPTTSFIIGRNGGEDTSRIDRGSISTRDRCENRDEIGSCFFFRGERERERVIGSWWHTLMARWKKTAFPLIRLKIRGWFRQGMIGKSCVLISIRECVEWAGGWPLFDAWSKWMVKGKRESLRYWKSGWNFANFSTPRYKLEIKRKFFPNFSFYPSNVRYDRALNVWFIAWKDVGSTSKKRNHARNCNAFLQFQPGL